MNWRHGVPIWLLFFASCSGAGEKGSDWQVPAVPDAGGYVASPHQARVDLSFSDISIDAPFAEVRSRLKEIRVDGCEEGGECAWRDADGVRHYFFGDSPDSLHVVVKWVQACEFEGHPIPALGIGSARRRDQVLAAVRRFLPEADFECGEGGEDQTETCNATLDPGWVTIKFDASGSLIEVRLDGYHFT